MKTYARIERNTVMELVSTDGDIHAMFHKDLSWVETGDAVGVAPGWHYDGSSLTPSTAVEDSPQEAPAP